MFQYRNRIIQRNNLTLCKVSPLKYTYCVKNHTGLFIRDYFVIWATYCEVKKDEKKHNPQNGYLSDVSSLFHQHQFLATLINSRMHTDNIYTAAVAV